MLKTKRTNKFESDIKLLEKRHKDFAKLKTVLELLVTPTSLPPKYQDHPLRGNYVGYRECHLEPDWLLICRIQGEYLILTRTGRHNDLFR